MSSANGEPAGTIHEVRWLIRPVEGQPVPQFFFEPSGLYIEPGDTARFLADTPHHTVTAYHPLQGKPQRVPDGVEPFSSPVLPIGSTWEYTFDVPGLYDVMAARARVPWLPSPFTGPPLERLSTEPQQARQDTYSLHLPGNHHSIFVKHAYDVRRVQDGSVHVIFGRPDP